MIERLANGFEVAYDRAGSGVPLLLIHGWPHSRALWAGQTSGLATQAQCIAPDLRGFGESVVHGPWSIEQFADDLDALLEALSIPNAVVCGLSMGGYVALSLLRRHPARVRGLILASTRATADSPEAREKRARLIEFIEQRGMEALANRQLATMVGTTTLESRPDVRASLLEMMAAAPPDGVIGALRAMADRADSSDLLPTITVPTLVVGGAEDTFIPSDELRAMATRIPHSRFELLGGSGHVCAYECPGAFNHVVGEFLRDV
ncbi:MAG: alpha/beta fold hydrolase [Gemmatimonadaceae bacterium]